MGGHEQLCLKRKLYQQIVIRVPPSSEVSEITVTVVEVWPGSARLGIHAQPHVTINRKEVQDKIDAGIPRNQQS